MAQMDIILLQRVEKLGNIGDVVSVKPGFARNFLLPQGKALRANEQNKAKFEADRERIEQENADKRTAAETESKKLDGVKIVLIRQASDSGQLYGSVSARDIATALTEESGVSVDKNDVSLAEPIKALGMHTVTVALHPEVQVEVEANVARSNEEAEMQARGINVLEGDDDEILTESERRAKEALERAERQAAAEASGMMVDADGNIVDPNAEADAEDATEGGEETSDEATESEADADESKDAAS